MFQDTKGGLSRSVMVIKTVGHADLRHEIGYSIDLTKNMIKLHLSLSETKLVDVPDDCVVADNE